MLVTLGWMLLVGSPPALVPPDPAPAVHRTAGRVSLWTDRDEPYRRGDDAEVYLNVVEPSYVAVFRVDTDGRIRVLFPRQPWTDSYVPDQRELEVTGARGGRAFRVDDDPGVGYLFAVASAEPLDFRDITRGDYWDYRLIDGGRIQGDPYVRLTDLAARLAPDADYDYDVVPYYVDHRYDYPRFVCYDCHAYAGFSEWDPYRTSCSRYRVVVRDDPRYYPYRYGGRNVVTQRLAHPGPRYVIRDADPRRPSVTHDETERRRSEEAGDIGRTSADVGGRGSVPVPGIQSLRRRDHEVARELSPARRVLEERRPPAPPAADGDQPADAEPGADAADQSSDRPPATTEPVGREPTRTPVPRSQRAEPPSDARPSLDHGQPTRDPSTRRPPTRNPPTRNPPAPAPAAREPRDAGREAGRDTGRQTPEVLRPSKATPRSTGEPELKRRRP